MRTILMSLGLALMMLVPASLAVAQRGTGARDGVARQLVKPEVVSIAGELKEIRTGPCQHTTGRSPIGTHLILTVGQEELNVHLGPATEVVAMVEELNFGDTIEADVFRTERLSPDEYVAVSVTAAGKQYVLRDSSLRPIWAGNGRRWRQLRIAGSTEPAVVSQDFAPLVTTTLLDPPNSAHLTKVQVAKIGMILRDAEQRVYDVLTKAQKDSLTNSVNPAPETEEVPEE
jgi:hypothetical protein